MQGTLLLKEQTPTEVTYWIVINGVKVGRTTIRTLDSRTGKALNYKEVWY